MFGDLVIGEISGSTKAGNEAHALIDPCIIRSRDQLLVNPLLMIEL